MEDASSNEYRFPAGNDLLNAKVPFVITYWIDELVAKSRFNQYMRKKRITKREFLIAMFDAFRLGWPPPTSSLADLQNWKQKVISYLQEARVAESKNSES